MKDGRDLVINEKKKKILFRTKNLTSFITVLYFSMSFFK